jgi:RNA recognition motif-containing protein
MTKRIYVGNLDEQVDVEQLEKLLTPFGKIINTEVFTDLSGRGEGFAFVEMKSSEAATRAIEQLDGQQFAGRRLALKKAAEEEEQVGPLPGSFGDRGGRGGGDHNYGRSFS